MSVETITVNYKPVSPLFKLPVRSTDQAGAWDVFVTEVIKEDEDCYVAKLGFQVEFSPDFKMMFAPRSSITKTKWNIQNSPGIGDADFRGEYSVRFRAFPERIKYRIIDVPSVDYHGNKYFENEREYYLSYPEFPYKVGDRCAQIFFQRRIEVEFQESENLSETNRGTGAYGSTGK